MEKTAEEMQATLAKMKAMYRKVLKLETKAKEVLEHIEEVKEATEALELV